MSVNLILASGSAIRAKLLSQAGFDFSVKKPAIDERRLEKEAELKHNPAEIALYLAQQKALAIDSDLYIIGCDQILEFSGDILHKVENIAQARDRLLDFAGKEHSLYSAVSLVKDGKEIWNIVKKSTLKMKEIGIKEVEQYQGRFGEAILSSVGCYFIEEGGIDLFDEITGSMEDIMGLPIKELAEQLDKLNLRAK